MKLIIKNVNRSWRDIKEKSYNALSFSIEGRSGEIYLTEDLDYPNSHNIHPIETENLREDELMFLASSIIEYIPTNHYLLSCGESWEEKERFFKILYHLLYDTSYIRTLKDSEGKEHYYPILKKL